MEDMDLTIKVTDYKSSGMRRSTLTFRKLLLVARCELSLGLGLEGLMGQF